MARHTSKKQVEGIESRNKGQAYKWGSYENTTRTSICQCKHPQKDMYASIYNGRLASAKMNALQAATKTNDRQESWMRNAIICRSHTRTLQYRRPQCKSNASMFTTNTNIRDVNAIHNHVQCKEKQCTFAMEITVNTTVCDEAIGVHTMKWEQCRWWSNSTACDEVTAVYAMNQ